MRRPLRPSSGSRYWEVVRTATWSTATRSMARVMIFCASWSAHPHFGGYGRLVTAQTQRARDQPLVVMILGLIEAIRTRGVDEADPCVERGVERGTSLFFGGPSRDTEQHGAEAQRAHCRSLLA